MARTGTLDFHSSALSNFPVVEPFPKNGNKCNDSWQLKEAIAQRCTVVFARTAGIKVTVCFVSLAVPCCGAQLACDFAVMGNHWYGPSKLYS
jgi:hypothetical protein